jgi:hypothetical protein
MIIAARFNGPPGSGNGGYSAGLVAAELSSDVDGGTGAIEVTLRRPPPLDRELTVRHEDVLRVFAGDDLIAEAKPAEVGDDEVVAPVSPADAEVVSRSYVGFRDHPFPTCFVCGPERAVGDGLRIFPGRLADGRVAAPFAVPDDASPITVWAALDCPSGWAVPLEDRPYVLGRIAVRVNARPVAGDACVVVGELVGEDGRKAFSRSTLYSPAGNVLALARATWVAL